MAKCRVKLSSDHVSLYNQLRYQEACGYGEEQIPEADEGRLSVQLNSHDASPDIGAANYGGDYLVVSSRTLYEELKITTTEYWKNIPVRFQECLAEILR